MTDVMSAPWFWWALAIAVALPVALVVLTEIHNALLRRRSYLARPVGLIRNYILPLGALLLLLLKATEVPVEATTVRIVATVLGFVVLILLLSGLNATVFQGAPDGTWRKRMPTIFLDVARFVLITVGVGVIFAYVWGANVGGLFTALGIGSVVLGLTLQNSVGQIISGLLVLFEQPFQTGDWVATRWIKGGRVVEVNWRATHLDSGNGVYVLPNSLLATEWFVNLSVPRDDHSIEVTTAFAPGDSPDLVIQTLTHVARQLPQLRPEAVPSASKGAAGEYITTIPVRSPADDVDARSTFLRWVWYAARRSGLRLDGVVDTFPDEVLLDDALQVVGRTLRLGKVDLELLHGKVNVVDRELLQAKVRMVRFGAGETLQFAGETPTRMMFIVSGSVRLVVATSDGASVDVRTLERGDFLGQTTLTREKVTSRADALGQVTVLEIARDQIEELVLRKPLLMQELGRAIEDRRATVRRALAHVGR